MNLSFVRGHCGWDHATLLLAEEIPILDYHSTALKVLDMPESGIEVGILEQRDDGIRLWVVANPERVWIPMCGGITQLIGMALVSTEFGQHFSLEWMADTAEANLITETGSIPISINPLAGTVITDMDAYVDFSYKLGVRLVETKGVTAFESGEFLVVSLMELAAIYPHIDFTRRDPGPHLTIINEMLRDRRMTMAMLWDHEGASGQYRLFPRFLDEASYSNPYEFQCGTGTVAVLQVIVYVNAVMGVPNGEGYKLGFEWGNPMVTSDPYGIRMSTVEFSIKSGRAEQVRYSHSVIEIVDEGKLEIY